MCDDDGEICESATPATLTSSPTSTSTADGHYLNYKTQQQRKHSFNYNSNNKVEQIEHWQPTDVIQWLRNSKDHFSNQLISCINSEAIDGQVLLTLSESDVRDFRYRLGYSQVAFGELKRFWLLVSQLQQQWTHEQRQKYQQLQPQHQYQLHGVLTDAIHTSCAPGGNATAATMTSETCPSPSTCQDCPGYNCSSSNGQRDCSSSKSSQRFVAPEYFKTAISLGYSFVVTWITSFVMVIVHERVPDMKRYPPLPDIFLDNVPHIPWAFNMCEITGSLLFTVWLIVLIFHKYRMVLLRRFFALAGTVFLLRCVTMLITSLSVPGTHLQCNQKDFAIDDPNVDMIGALVIRMTRAYRIWSGLGMSIQGVRTCGDYMFSGHTVALTLLNFFITEYTPRNLYFLHTMTWLLNMFGIFFILAAHEHYSIDVFVAFYITSRLFLYYHTLANNRALMQSDSTRTRVWFPMFSYFENHVDGMIPNDFDTPGSLISSMIDQLCWLKDQLVWVSQGITLPKAAKSLQMFNSSESELSTHPVGSPFHNSHQSMGSGMNNVRPTPNTRPTTPIKLSPQPVRRTIPLDIPTPVTSVPQVAKRTNATTPQQVKRSLVDASVSPYVSDMIKKDAKDATQQATKKQL